MIREKPKMSSNSKKYKILFIDEEKNQQEQFCEYMETEADKVEVKCLFPSKTIEKMLQAIDDEQPDAIVIDYKLNEIKVDINYNVPFSGTDIANPYQERHIGFPFFVMTSYDDDAVSESKDVNVVYRKNILHNSVDEGRASFKVRIVQQINKYKKRIRDSQNKLEELLQKRKESELTLNEQDKLVQLDSFLEKSLDSYSSIPDDFKTSQSLSKLSDLIEKVDEEIRKLN